MAQCLSALSQVACSNTLDQGNLDFVPVSSAELTSERRVVKATRVRRETRPRCGKQDGTGVCLTEARRKEAKKPLNQRLAE
jgi:hypothetical protein